jgi:DNA-binding NarL/FixJ family response regulator
VASVLICDERREVRDRLARFLAAVPAFDPVNTVASGEELLERYPHEHPDVVFVGTHRAIDTGIVIIRRLMAEHPQAAVLVFGAADDHANLTAAVASGARGFLCWDASHLEVYAALAHALAPNGDGSAPAVVPSVNGRPALTPREMQVLLGMSQGKSNHEIGGDLFLSEDTVKTHARRLFRKLGVHDRAQAVAQGFRGGLVH